MTGSVQRATCAHATIMAAVHAAAFPPPEAWGEDAIALQLALPGSFGFVDGRGGMLLARALADAAEVLTLAVAPGARRQGIATRLLNTAIVEASTRGAATLLLEVSAANAAAQALYRRAGFSEVGRRHGYYADGSDGFVLRLNLLSPLPDPVACPRG
jgi:[ribosomal protein S18]-alanine N-acetyltransferase